MGFNFFEHERADTLCLYSQHIGVAHGKIYLTTIIEGKNVISFQSLGSV